MQYVTITTAQALFSALGMSVFASIMAIVLTIMAFVHLTGRWADREQDRLDYMAEVEAWKAVYGRGERTCHDRGGSDDAGMDVFNCSECGCILCLYQVDGTNNLITHNIYDYPRYCPNCGRRVVD